MQHTSGEDWTEVAYLEAGEGPAVVPPSAVETVGDPRAVPEVRAVEPPPEAVGRLAVPRSAARVRAVAPEHGFPVRVLDGRSGQPVADASVLYYDTLSPDYSRFRRLRVLYSRDRELALAQAGDEVRSGPDGVAIVPHGIPTQSIAVRSGVLYGELQVSTKEPPPPGGYEIELQPDRQFRVRVVDTDGKPVAGVHMVSHIPVRDPKGQVRWVMLREGNNPSGADGLITLGHIQIGIDIVRRIGGGETRVYVGLDVPGLTRREPALDIRSVPEEPVELVLPALGSIAVQVRDADDAPVQRKVRLSAEPDFPVLGVPSDQQPRPHWTRETDAAGNVRFDRVALGQRFRVENVGPDVHPGERVECNGPVQPGATVEVALRRAFTAAIVSGIALGDDGPLRGVALSIKVKGANLDPAAAYLTECTVRTGDDGRFELRLPPTETVRAAKGGEAERNLYDALRVSVLGKSQPQPGTEVALPRRLAAARYQIGDVRLRLPRLLAAGRVYIDDAPAKFFDRLLIEFKNTENRDRWERVADLALIASKGGRFEIRGEDRGRELRLRPRTWGYLPAPAIALVPGRKDHDVRLYRAGFLRAAVLHDQAVAGADIDVRLRPVGIDRPVDSALEWCFIGRADKLGSGNTAFRKAYWWSGLPPGTYRLELRLLGARDPFLVHDNLQPHFGLASVYEAPVEIFSLRGRIHRCKVRAVDARDRPLAGLAIPLGQAALVGIEGVKMGREGAVLYSAQQAQDVMVVVRGYRPQQVHGVFGERVVRMEPGIPITVNLPSMPLPKGLGLSVSIRRRAYRPAETYRVGLRHPVVARAQARFLADLLAERSVQLRYRGRRQWKATLMEPGQFVLELMLLPKGGKPTQIPGYGPRLLMVRDTSVEHEFNVAIDTERLRKAIQDLGLTPPAQKPRQTAGKKDPRRKR